MGYIDGVGIVTGTERSARPNERVRLDLEGMTCASCAARIEKRLNGLDGVEATVNYAADTAAVTFDPAVVTVDELLATVAAAGYRAAAEDDAPRERDETGLWRRRLIVSAVLTVPLVLVSMVGALQFDGWEWAALALATPVVLWGGWPFHRTAFVNARHGAASMDTLVSVGTLAAFGWSLAVLVTGADADTYFEAAAVITTLILLGRFLEARARRRSGEAIRALLELGAKDARVLRDGKETLVPVARARRR